MRELFWNIVAKILTIPKIRDKIVLHAMKRPHRLQLYGYMSRWWVLPRTKWLPFAIRLHHIHRADRGKDVHNHPGTFRTFLLRGWYIEEKGSGQFMPINQGESRLVRKNTFHRIVVIDEGGCLTLVIEWGFWAGNKWGFLVDGIFVDHEDYHGER